MDIDAIVIMNDIIKLVLWVVASFNSKALTAKSFSGNITNGQVTCFLQITAVTNRKIFNLTCKLKTRPRADSSRSVSPLAKSSP